MCIVFFEWTEDRLLICHNRDEFFSRPTDNTTWWPIGDNDSASGHGERFEILAPRDRVSGGTWFGFEKTTGRCAFLTNIRELDLTKYSSSRGEFVVNYLKSDKNLSALEYLQREFGDGSVAGAPSKEYAGFNLVVFSGRDLAYFSNRYPEDESQKGPIPLSMRTSYGLSNSILQEPYAKVRKGLKIFDQILNRSPQKNAETNSSSDVENGNENDTDRMMEDLENMMLRTEYCPGDPLPRTGEPGFPEEKVKHRSCICVPNVKGYGTRTTIRFLLEREEEKMDNETLSAEELTTGSSTAMKKQPQHRRLRCIEKNWNTETLQWELSTELNCIISLP